MKNSHKLPDKTEKGAANTLIFLHVPKTAGTTLNSILDYKYKNFVIHSIYEPNQQKKIDEFSLLPLEDRKNIHLLRGHGIFGLHEHLPNPSIYITLLRNPIERVVSHYFYVKRTPEHYLYNTVMSQNLSLEEYVSSGISRELNNGQVRDLSRLKPDFSHCSREMLNLAINNVYQHFSVVGVQEKFDEFLLLLSKKLGWRDGWRGYPFYQKKNVTKKTFDGKTISPAAIEIIEKYNDLDIEFYEFVSKRFDELIAEVFHPLAFKLELAWFRFLNRLKSN
ncbi:MAG: sulfotransferase family 2 domain-containing protein [Chloroflexaceae bacterium]|nr:sulfotransferase family 2 domain-containing protein [Chloroflexaceae bacterium]